MKPLFYIQREGAVAGPYDLVQMAGLLRRRIINGETPTRREGEEAWKPFAWQPQFSVAREMPADAVSNRTAELDEEAGARAAGPLLMPSGETLVKLAAFAVAALLTFGGAFLIGRFDPSAGEVLVVAGCGLAVVGQAMILVRVLDSEGMSPYFYYFVPGYDIYFLAANFWQIFPWLSLKYVGAAMALGAVLGMG